MKAVLISIRPKWCELIANGKKTIELRKTRPKTDVPFKCYIYCVTPRYPHEDSITVFRDAEGLPPFCFYGGGKVIGEFVCDDIDEVSVHYDTLYCVNNTQPKKFTQLRLTLEQVRTYLGEQNHGYTWHISDLVIYDKPKELSEFHKLCLPQCNFSEECGGTNAKDCLFAISRAPQSWCYVEELK